MPSERLDALLRQRALITQHLAWLDAEIARATDAPTPPRSLGDAQSPTDAVPVSETEAPAASTPESPSSVPSGLPEAAPAALAEANARADEIIAKYSATDRFDEQGAKRGCILLAVAVFLLGTAGLMTVYLLYYN